jgi:homogentisate 1,2-dioxygenase
MRNFKNFEVTENADGQLIVTAKSGFAIRLATEYDVIHVHAKEVGALNRVYTVNANNGKVVVHRSRTTSFCAEN